MRDFEEASCQSVRFYCLFFVILFTLNYVVKTAHWKFIIWNILLSVDFSYLTYNSEISGNVSFSGG